MSDDHPVLYVTDQFGQSRPWDGECLLCQRDALRSQLAVAKAHTANVEGLYILACNDRDALRQRLANTELELTHATKTCAEQQWRAEQAQARLAVAEQTLKAHGIHVAEKWCWCGPTVEKHDE